MYLEFHCCYCKLMNCIEDESVINNNEFLERDLFIYLFFAPTALGGSTYASNFQGAWQDEDKTGSQI